MPRVETFQVRAESWPLSQPFRIARGAKTEAVVVTVTLTIDGHTGRGECCPYPRYGETVEQTIALLEAIDWQPFAPLSLTGLKDAAQALLPPGAARNALDCALWDLIAKSTGRPAWQIAGVLEPRPLLTCYTLSLDAPPAMAAQAVRRSDCPLLKLKLGDSTEDAARMRAVRAARPDARLVADVNEGWHPEDLPGLLDIAAECSFELIEQPLPEGRDAALAARASTVPLCADRPPHRASRSKAWCPAIRPSTSSLTRTAV